MKRVKKGTRRGKLTTWVKKSRQKGGFIFMGLAAIGSAIAAAMTAAAPAVATGIVGAAASYATTKVLQKSFGKGRKRVRRIPRKH
jgi:F0F1-type ATP synthase membrane subunit c/vacuolar-type H+-ATPase subunit K